MSFKRIITSMGILAGTTIGAGIFALPYVASRIGWVPFLSYLVGFSIFIVGAHYLYSLVLEKTDGAEGLVGLVRVHLGKNMSRLAFVAIIFGLLLTLSIYILLGARFLSHVFSIQLDLALILFWIAVSIPLLFKLRRFVRMELVVTVLMILVFLATMFAHPLHPHALPAFTHRDFFFGFGPLLFALAGWTALEPMQRARRAEGERSSSRLLPTLILGTLLCAAVYALFVLGISSVSTGLTSDIFAGLTLLAPWYIVALLIFGLCAIVTSYLPMALEIKNALVGGLKWPVSLAISGVMFTPYILVLLGLDNVITLIDLVGGVFLALQYLVILLVARRALQLHGVRRIALDLIALVFFLAIVYQFYYLFA